jgi:hypothetical protein
MGEGRARGSAKTKCVIGPLVGLLHNIARLKSLILAPARISYVAAYIMNLIARVELEKTGYVSEYDPTIAEKPSQDISARFAELFVQEAHLSLHLAKHYQSTANLLPTYWDQQH